MSGCAVFMEIRGTYMFASPYSEDSGVGTLVMLSGVADSVKNTQSGGHMTTSVNGVKVFIPEEMVCPDLADGDFIHIWGIVDEYMDEMEIRSIKIKKIE